MYVTGNFKTQVISNILDCIGMSLLILSTWQLFTANNGTNPTIHPTSQAMNITSTNDKTLDLALASVGLLVR